MRRISILVLGAFLVTGMAYANEDKNERSTKLECRFLGDHGKKNDGKGKDPSRCEVVAKVCDDCSDASAMNNNERCFDFMRVFCDGREVFEGRAFHDSFGDFEFLKGKGEDHVVLKYISHDGHRRDSVVSSWLKVGGNVLEGFCELDRGGHNPHPSTLQ